MRRLLALVAAAAMVIVALFVRSGDDGGGNTGEQAERLVCATELEQACRQLARTLDDVDFDLTIEPTALTATMLTEGAEPPGVWLTLYPWPDIVTDARERGSLTATTGKPSRALARSPLVLVAVTERAARLQPRCRGKLTWRCVGDAAGRPWATLGGDVRWGDVKPAHPRADTGAGLAILGQAVASYFGTTDVSATDLRDDTGFQGWFNRLEQAIRTFVPRRSSLVADQLLEPGSIDVTGALEAHAGPLLAAAANRERLTISYPSPMATADVVAVPPAGGGTGELWSAVTGDAGARALAEAGWRVDGQPAARGVPSTPGLPPTNGLPSAGVLDALRSVWRDATR